MNTSLLIASSGLRAYQGKLDTIAGNISNVETAGYKRRESSFSENLTVSIQNQAEQAREEGRLSPFGIRTTFGTRLVSTALDFTQGSAKQTDRPLDLMIEGKGYFQVRRTTGQTTEVLYTRAGSFQLSPIGGGRFQLVNAHGNVLLDQNGTPVEWSGSGELTVADDGTISGTNQRIGLVDFTNPQMLKEEGGVYRLSGGTAIAVTSQIKQGYLETSNVDLNQEMTDMIKAQRGYQANARALGYADQMMGVANGIMRT